MRRTAVVIGTAATLMGCSAAETPQQAQARMDQETAAFKAAIKGIEGRWEGFYAASQPDSIASLFTESGQVLGPNAPAVVGRAAIAADQANQMKAYTFTLGITSEEASANGPIGIERGSYGVTGKVKKGAPKGTPPTMTDHGTYLAHWHNVNGTWQVVTLAFTSSWTATPPRPVPPRRR